MTNSAQWSPRQERFMNDRTLRCSRYESYEEEEDLPCSIDTSSVLFSESKTIKIGIIARFFGLRQNTAGQFAYS